MEHRNEINETIALDYLSFISCSIPSTTSGHSGPFTKLSAYYWFFCTLLNWSVTNTNHNIFIIPVLRSGWLMMRPIRRVSELPCFRKLNIFRALTFRQVFLPPFWRFAVQCYHMNNRTIFSSIRHKEPTYNK